MYRNPFIHIIRPAQAVAFTAPLTVPVIIKAQDVQKLFLASQFRTHASANDIHCFKLVFIPLLQLNRAPPVTVNFNKRFHHYNSAVRSFLFQNADTLDCCFTKVIFDVPAIMYGKRNGASVFAGKPRKETYFVYRYNKELLTAVFCVEAGESAAELLKSLCKMRMCRKQTVRITKMDKVPNLLYSGILGSSHPSPDFREIVNSRTFFNITPANA